MPAITRVLSSGFFIPADTNSSVSSTKATVGLGLDLPTELLRTTFAHDEGDCSVVEPILQESNVGSISSPPLLPTRLSRRTSPTFSAESEYYPMSTPSPSICGMSFDAFERLLDISLPADSPIVETNVGIGIASQCLDAPELAKVSHRDPAVGLGFDLPCLAERELVTIIRPTLSTTGIDFSFLEEADIADAVTSPAALNIAEGAVEELSERSLAGLGFDSSFWRTYATVLTERFD